jgi:predicted helicase
MNRDFMIWNIQQTFISITVTDSMQAQNSVLDDFNASFNNQQNQSNSQENLGQASNSQSHT